METAPASPEAESQFKGVEALVDKISILERHQAETSNSEPEATRDVLEDAQDQLNKELDQVESQGMNRDDVLRNVYARQLQAAEFDNAIVQDNDPQKAAFEFHVKYFQQKLAELDNKENIAA